MAEVEPHEYERVLRAAVGDEVFLRAQRHVEVDAFVNVRWNRRTGHAGGRLRGHQPGTVMAFVVRGAGGVIAGVDGFCACGVRGCGHPAGLVMVALGIHVTSQERTVAGWESALADLVRADRPRRSEDSGDTIALQFEVLERPARRIVLRPVVPGRTGWVRGGVSWANLAYRRDRHRRLLMEIAAVASGSDGPVQQSIYLDAFPSRRIWDLLAEADEVGLPLVQPGRGGPVIVERQPARLSVRVERDGDGLVLSAGDDLLLGVPPHGLARWAGPGRVLRLGPLAGSVPTGLADVLRRAAIRVPAADEPRFFDRFYPDLARQVDLLPSGETVVLPEIVPPRLRLSITPAEGHTLRLRWDWVLTVGDHSAVEPFGLRRHDDDLVAQVPWPIEAETTLGGDVMLRFVTETLPRLEKLDGVDVDRPEGPVDYQEAQEPPQITFTGTASGNKDWFDLTVQVTVAGAEVAFNQLFTALARDQEYLVLPGGVYFALDRPELARLRDLITESRTLQDAPPETLRVHRAQVGLWDELADVGVLSGQAEAWQRAVRTLTVAGAGTEHAVPAAVHAELRPYQKEGFRWLAALQAHGLGGILADDMGLGKTLQALALICHARAAGRFLVLAPASVVHNWVNETARFTPDLRVRAVTQTKARRGGELTVAVGDAELVVTSYTLFRLEFEDYAELEWAGLILDEAQFVKNAHSQGYRCASALAAPFKLAITGTPMENHLAELWALCSITAPGLFPDLARFTDYYRTPIERDRDPERLAHLRRRIRPLMLRRRKSDVAVELPEKQEQVIELELDRRHRKVYETYLQRERQKVLGLLDDLDKHRFEVLRSLTLLRQASLDVSLVDPQHAGIPSAKLEALSEQVAGLVAEGHRALVFSQFTRFLGAARDRLAADGVACEYLDGSTRDRAAVLERFRAGTAPVFLISLKAGGFGLNLTEADFCLLLDPWWNPATEAQAVDRIHRIGQVRSVMVYRLVAKDTIEEKVMALKARKAELFAGVLDGGEFGSAQLTDADIRDLLT